jgi:ubiquinone biosynthesis protein Coq4
MKTVANILAGAIGRPIDIEALIETSPYLKHDKLREWVGYLMLRRIGDFEMTNAVAYAGSHVRLMRELFSVDRMNELFAAERRKNPQLDAWFAERHVSSYTAEDLAAYPKGTFGALYYERVAAMGYELDLGAGLPLETDFDLWVIRGLQLHDPEHLLGGGGFDLVGEIMPSAMRHGAILRHFSPELAGALNAPTLLLNLSQLSGCMLYTPHAYPTLFERFQRAWTIGWTSGPYFLARFEDVFHLPIAEARRALGLNGVDELDTSAVSATMFDEMTRRSHAVAL